MDKDNITDLSQFRDKKQKEKEEQEKQKILDENTNTFINLVTKPQDKLNPDELKVYDEIGLLLQFNLAEKFTMALAVFRDQVYIINYVGERTFEYIGKFEEVLGRALL